MKVTPQQWNTVLNDLYCMWSSDLWVSVSVTGKWRRLSLLWFCRNSEHQNVQQLNKACIILTHSELRDALQLQNKSGNQKGKTQAER
jgi:hypothetical protein